MKIKYSFYRTVEQSGTSTLPVSQPQSDLKNKSTGRQHLDIYPPLLQTPIILEKLGHSAPPLQCKQVATFAQTCEEQGSLISLHLRAEIASSTILLIQMGECLQNWRYKFFKFLPVI